MRYLSLNLLIHKTVDFSIRDMLLIKYLKEIFAVMKFEEILSNKDVDTRNGLTWPHFWGRSLSPFNLPCAQKWL